MYALRGGIKPYSLTIQTTPEAAEIRRQYLGVQEYLVPI